MPGSNGQHFASFVIDFTELCTETEIPDQFAVWTALAGVSAALGRNVYCEFGVLTIFPNLYVCLIAGSGQKKSTSIEMLEPLLYGMEPKPNLIAQKITPEALFEAMRTIEIKNTKHLGKVSATGFIVLDELTSLMTLNTYEGLSPLLLQFYNCKSVVEYRTKTAGTVQLKETCLGFIAATTPPALSRSIPDSAIGDGLTARINFIYSKKPVTLVPIPYDTERKRDLRDRLSRSISRISMLSGRVRLSHEAQEILVQDYLLFHTDTKNPLKSNPLLGGYSQRHQVHCLKVAMLLCCAEEGELVISAQHMETAIKLVELYEHDLPSLVNLISSSEHGLATHQVLEIIRNQGGKTTRLEIMKCVSNRLSSRELDSVLDTLEKGGYTKTVMGAMGIHYELR